MRAPPRTNGMPNVSGYRTVSIQYRKERSHTAPMMTSAALTARPGSGGTGMTLSPASQPPPPPRWTYVCTVCPSVRTYTDVARGRVGGGRCAAARPTTAAASREGTRHPRPQQRSWRGGGRGGRGGVGRRGFLPPPGLRAVVLSPGAPPSLWALFAQRLAVCPSCLLPLPLHATSYLVPRPPPAPPPPHFSIPLPPSPRPLHALLPEKNRPPPSPTPSPATLHGPSHGREPRRRGGRRGV